MNPFCVLPWQSGSLKLDPRFDEMRYVRAQSRIEEQFRSMNFLACVSITYVYTQSDSSLLFSSYNRISSLILVYQYEKFFRGSNTFGRVLTIIFVFSFFFFRYYWYFEIAVTITLLENDNEKQCWKLFDNRSLNKIRIYFSGNCEGIKRKFLKINPRDLIIY